MDAQWRQRFAWCGRIAAIAAVLAVVWSMLLTAQEMAVPVASQWPFFQKILSFQRVLDRGSHTDEPVLAILYQSKFRPSLEVYNELSALLKDSRPVVAGAALRVVAVDLTRESDLEAQLVLSNVSFVYVAPLRSFNLDTIVGLCRSRKILSLSGVPEYIAQGLSVGIASRGDRPRILINRRAALLEGSDFHAQLLKLATIVE